MRARILLALALLLSPGAALAESPSAADRALFAEGVAAYESGRFGEAAGSFRRLLEAGHHDADVLFNFGNAAYREGRYPIAAWAFEWARRLRPADERIRENLELARAQLVVDEVPSELAPAARRLLDWLRLVPLGWLAAAFAVPWCLGWVLAAWRAWRRAAWATGPALGLLLLAGVLALPLVIRARQADGPAEGLVVAPEVTVRSGPADSYAALFELHAGTGLQELERRQSWVRVRVPHGPGGWVPAPALAVFGRPETLPGR